jgi:hypothetical protein
MKITVAAVLGLALRGARLVGVYFPVKKGGAHFYP